MKINEKSLSRYACSGAPPDKEGYLHKRGDFNRGYQKRWFILKGNLFFYYEKRTDKDPLGMIVLEGCMVELSDHEDGYTFMINFPGSNTRTYILSADTQEEMEAWMKVLSGASYDYMKLCVNELKAQLQDVDSNSNRKLLQSAFEDRNTFVRSGLIQDKSGLSNNKTNSAFGGHARRHNPFDDDSFDHESMISRSESIVSEKKARTFLEMHEEFKQQIKEITLEWLKTHPHSALTKQQNECCA
ncbi:sesquipedalian-1-like [Mercenaria mercenaria]|uniref:sesquipedalian-1-like n=1 Tax=Mercenaria mercenaria TaxID=6596 RepID=UPI00234E3A22|nr:sesquipedalian-1-like [Mercenaria mercenaria]XP_053376040.1 sesquipedalian-1-like [Mercenaria mercenaria]XP_053376041.1 sesquipedalian-1-like [Mercenaria mercenaria]XP_053376042.1 sesquipedalian-1-like [Mercenaria mercenaria]XP_053376043.1 sesquipedalian-1-like [Mercenaria mercenaria]XP_053376044.1 sesquipedalian-1-like [Mercenaria mercenaria]XP_053376045.1 sesquipedalian-1-like [Mercenaria mercenaria]XP_053376046.1 sesquipedalian-1-like [Mercenaria mercenaria]